MLRRHTHALPAPLHQACTVARALAGGVAALAFVACGDPTTTAPRAPSDQPSASVTAGPGGKVVVTSYDSKSLDDYQQKWSNIYGPLELSAGGTLGVSAATGVTVSAVPFHVGADLSVFDHLKYIAVSNQAFQVPASGSLMFSVTIKASTPGTVNGRIVHGCYGPSFSWDGIAPCATPWKAVALQGQQAGVVLNMINFATGQLFDWFVSSDQVFALIERLPSNVTGSGAVGLDKAYTQIIKVQSIAPGKQHTVAINYSRALGNSTVEYFLDGKSFAKVGNVGVPLDVQQLSYSGIYPSLGPGELVANAAESFVIGHGLFSLLDAFPFQHPDRPDLSVSVPISERLFGQGATGSFQNFTVTQITY